METDRHPGECYVMIKAEATDDREGLQPPEAGGQAWSNAT
jgi:hypothetical protein